MTGRVGLRLRMSWRGMPFGKTKEIEESFVEGEGRRLSGQNAIWQWGGSGEWTTDRRIIPFGREKASLKVPFGSHVK